MDLFMFILLEAMIYIFEKIWEVFGHYFFKYFLPFSLYSSLDSHNIYVALLDSVLKSHSLVSFVSSFFISVLYSSPLIISSAYLHLLLNPSNGFFISVIILQASEFPFGFFLDFLFVDIIILSIHFFLISFS